MIRTINICVNAAHPELPIAEATTFVGSPSAVFVRGVPKSVGLWQITAVAVAATYPDNSTRTVAAVESADGVWVATLPATATSGRTASGLRILADGVDENGATVTGYVLGLADFAVYSLLPVPAPGETFYMLRLFDAVPSVAKKGDVATVVGVLKYYNGTTWLPFADLSNYYTATETDEAIERVAAYYITYNAQGAAFPTAADLLNATTVYSGGVVRTPTRNDYAVVLADETHDGAEWRYIYAIPDGSTTGQWEAQYPIETNDYTALANKPQINGHILTGNQTGAQLGLALLSDLRYSFNMATVSSGTTPTVTNVIDRATNTVTLESSVTSVSVVLPAVVQAHSRDFFILVRIMGSAAPAFVWIDPETSDDANIAFGEDSLADVDVGANLILFTEVEPGVWLVSVKHEEAAS